MTNVIAVSYNIPVKRLVDWVERNSQLMIKYGFNAILVVDKDFPLDFVPNWVRIIKFPIRLKRFNLSKCKNFGIRAAGPGIVISTDIDIRFTESFCARVSSMKEDEYLVPLYYNVKDWDDCNMECPSQRTMGTCAAHYSKWELIHGYDERLTGYGSDDAIPINAFNKLRMIGNRHAIPVFHVNHDVKWNEEFNPLNRDENQKFLFDSEQEWMLHERSKTWGRPEFEWRIQQDCEEESGN